MENQKSDLKLAVGHIREECVKDPLFLTKILVTTFGKNIFTVVIRVAGYVAVFWVLTTQMHVSNGLASFAVLCVILIYNSFKMVYGNIISGAKNGKQNP